MKLLILIIIFTSINISCQVTTKEQLQKAEQLINERKYLEASAYLEEIISKDSLNQEAHYFLGQAYYKPLFVEGLKMVYLDLQIAKRASGHFKRAIEISPYYKGKVFVLGPYSKIQTIWGSMALNYILKGNPDSAKWALLYGQSEGGFVPAMLEYNKNIMAGCEQDAILFTNGDNDTFPIWFLQMIESYRTDITLINVNLLNVDWYIKQLKNNYPFGNNNLSLNINDEKIDQLRPISWQDTEIELPVDDPLNKENKIVWTLKPTFENKALRVQDQLILEILKTNNWKRPVYFSITVDESGLIGLSEYLSLEGLVRKVNTHKEKISPERINKNITQVYTYKGMNDEHLKFDDDLKMMYQNYRHLYLQLVNYYYEKEERQKAKQILDLMNENFPEDLLPYTNLSLKNEVKELNKKASEE